MAPCYARGMATRYRFGLEADERLFRGVPHGELIRGEVYRMSPRGPQQAFAVARLVQRFAEGLGVYTGRQVRLPGEEAEPQAFPGVRIGV